MKISDSEQFSITYKREVEFLWEGSFEDLPEDIRAAVEVYEPADEDDAPSDHLYAVLSDDTDLLNGLDSNATEDVADTDLVEVS